MMKVVTPLSDISSYEPLVEAGADEFFCGFIPFEWLKVYSSVLPLNRRENHAISWNICTLSSMKILRKMVEYYKVPVKITFNAHYYIESQYPVLIDIVKKLLESGFNNFIIADIAFIMYLRDKGFDCNIHLSGEAEVYNRMSIRFLDRFNIARYVFPRKTPIENMKSCISNSGVLNKEYEAFILNALCQFSGGFCNALHCDELQPICSMPQKISKTNGSQGKFAAVENTIRIKEIVDSGIRAKTEGKTTDSDKNKIPFGLEGCGVCKIKELMDIGVTHLKIVGRGYSLDSLINDVKNVREIINTAAIYDDYGKFENAVKENYFKNKCPEYCYYMKSAGSLYKNR